MEHSRGPARPRRFTYGPKRQHTTASCSTSIHQCCSTSSAHTQRACSTSIHGEWIHTFSYSACSHLCSALVARGPRGGGPGSRTPHAPESRAGPEPRAGQAGPGPSMSLPRRPGGRSHGTQSRAHTRILTLCLVYRVPAAAAAAWQGGGRQDRASLLTCRRPGHAELSLSRGASASH